MEEEAYWAWAI